MGIDCIQNEDQTVTVKVTNDHQRDIVTKSHKLPFFEKRNGYFLHSAFVRIGGNREFGSDGNPLVYAIKGLKDFRIDVESCQLLHKELTINFTAISDRVRKFGPVPYIFYTPSASQLSRFLAFRLHRIMGARECAILDVFEKQSYQDVLADCMRRKASAKVGSDDWKIMSRVINEINRFGKFALKEPFRMKDLPMDLRKHVNPFRLIRTAAMPADIAGARVLVVEDTIGSGRSSECLAGMLRNAGVAEVIVVSAFSPVQPISFVKNTKQARIEIGLKHRRVRSS